ncbi:hypothetical protein ES702_02750 [subsurface metagenome]
MPKNKKINHEKRVRINISLSPLTLDILKQVKKIDIRKSYGKIIDEGIKNSFYNNIETLVKEKIKIAENIQKINDLLSEYDEDEVEKVKEKLRN